MNELRDLLPGIQNITYLDYGRTSFLMKPVAERIASLFHQAQEPFQFHREQWFKLWEDARQTVASLIAADRTEIAFTTSTSSGLSLIANSIRWNDGDRILYPADEFPINRFVWDNIDGVITQPIAPQPGISFCEQLEKMDLTQVRLVAISAVSFCDGRRHDIEQIGQFCRAKNILLSVDAMQGVGAVPINATHCDFLACGGQKWLFGPIGTGFVYFKKAMIPTLRVPGLGWASIQSLPDFEAKKFHFVDGAQRFEQGYFDIAALAGLALSIETMGKIGWEKIYARIQHLAATLRQGLVALGCPAIDNGPSSGIVAFDHSNAESIHNKLLEKKIYTTQRGERLRVSMHASVSDDDLDRFLSNLKRLL